MSTPKQPSPWFYWHAALTVALVVSSLWGFYALGAESMTEHAYQELASALEAPPRDR